jgi:hypothetical protein
MSWTTLCEADVRSMDRKHGRCATELRLERTSFAQPSGVNIQMSSSTASTDNTRSTCTGMLRKGYSAVASLGGASDKAGNARPQICPRRSNWEGCKNKCGHLSQIRKQCERYTPHALLQWLGRGRTTARDAHGRGCVHSHTYTYTYALTFSAYPSQ